MSSFFRLKSLGHGVSADNGILKASAVAELQEAEGIVAEATAQAKAMIEDAKRVYDSEKQRGYADGRAELDQQRASQLMEDQHRVDARLSDMERDLGHLVFDCVKRIIEGFDDEALAMQVAGSALSSMRTERRGQLHVSSANFDITKDRLSEIVEKFPEIELIDVIEDPELDAPNVRLESKLGVVAFVLDDTLETLKRLLERN